MPQNDQALLMQLTESGLEFVVIGGVCVVFHGVPMATFDLDVCCPFGEENVRRIAGAVRDLHPLHRLTPNTYQARAVNREKHSVTKIFFFVWRSSEREVRLDFQLCSLERSC